MTSRQLEQILMSDIVLRSGYIPIMDLVRLGKKLFYPNPGQYEQF
jgi:hypothetical protein